MICSGPGLFSFVSLVFTFFFLPDDFFVDRFIFIFVKRCARLEIGDNVSELGEGTGTFFELKEGDAKSPIKFLDKELELELREL